MATTTQAEEALLTASQLNVEGLVATIRDTSVYSAVVEAVSNSKDGLGNVRYTTDNAGATLQTYTYDPYGNIASGSGSNYTFQSQQIDTEDGLTYLRARYYDPTTGSFKSRDPLTGSLGNPRHKTATAMRTITLYL